MIDFRDEYEVIGNIFTELKKINDQLREIKASLNNGPEKEESKKYIPKCPVCKNPASKYELDKEDGISYLGKCDHCNIVFHTTPK